MSLILLTLSVNPLESTPHDLLVLPDSSSSTGRQSIQIRNSSSNSCPVSYWPHFFLKGTANSVRCTLAGRRRRRTVSANPRLISRARHISRTNLQVHGELVSMHLCPPS